jgi:hypothetical protein
MEFSDTPDLADLVAMIHEAALDPDLWGPIARRLSDVFGGACLRLDVVDRARAAPLLGVCTGYDTASQRKLAEHYLTPESNPGILFLVSTPPLTVEIRERLVDDRALVKMDYYHDMMRPFDLWHAAMINMHCDRRYVAPSACSGRVLQDHLPKVKSGLCGCLRHISTDRSG